jgi:hypothetical protein
MNELELRRGLNDAVAAGSPPLALDSAGMLARAKRQRRVRVVGVSAGSTVAAALAALGVVLALPGGASPGGVGAAGRPDGCQSAAGAPVAVQTATKLGKDGKPVPGQPTSVPTGQPTSVPTGGATEPSCPDPTETPWPDGQTDRTARSGPHFQKGVQLQQDATDLLPAGFAAVQPSNQSQFERYVGQLQVWNTQTIIGARKGNRTGTVLVENFSADPNSAHTPLCTVAANEFAGKAADCQTLSVAGKTVAFFNQPSNNYSPQLQQWAAYRSPDGAITFVAQGKTFASEARPSGHPLTALPYSKGQLVALAVNSRLAAG